MKLRIFLASSNELVKDRREFELFLSRRNQLADEAFLDLQIWETHADAVSQTRLQDEYNKTLAKCDVFVMLFHSKVGRYTREEFETAYARFMGTGRPAIYTYFKSAPVRTRRQPGDAESLASFQDRLGELGHFCPSYRHVEDLQLQFGRQLDKLLIAADQPRGQTTLSVSLLSEPPSHTLLPSVLTYRSEQTTTALVVRPHMPYLDKVERGETMRGHSFWSHPFERKTPVLDVRLLNNETATLVVEEIELDVRCSELVEKELLFVRSGTYNGIDIRNEGWADLTHAKLQLRFPGTSLPATDESVEFRDKLWWPVDPDALRPAHRTQQRSQSDPPEQLEVEGVLSYVLGSAPSERREFRFATLVLLGSPQQSAAVEPSATYAAFVRAGEAPQSIRIPCAQVVKAGDLERFLVSVSSDRWHRFKCVVRLKMMDGSALESGAIDCEVLVPRSASERSGHEPTAALSGVYSEESETLSAGDGPKLLELLSFERLGSPASQLRLLSELANKATDKLTRRRLLANARVHLQPSPLFFTVLESIVAEETDFGLVDDALHALTSGAFDPGQVLRVILSRARDLSEDQSELFLVHRFGLALWGSIAGTSIDDSRYDRAIAALDDSDALTLLWLGNILPKFGVTDSAFTKAEARIKAVRTGVQLP